MTRLIAIGDTHIHQGPRNDTRLRALDQIIDGASALHGVGAFIWAGDLFHSRSTVPDRLQLADCVQSAARIGPVVICRGNHDGDGELEIFSRLRAAYPVYVVTRPECLRIRLATGQDATIAILPYPDKGGLVGRDVPHGDLVRVADEAFDAIFVQFAHELAQARANGDLTWFMGHVNIAGAVMSSGQPSVGHELEIRQTHLDRLGEILKVVNHVHKPQEIAGAIYPGSIAPMDWGETHECSYLSIEMRDSLDFTVTRQRIDVPPMYRLEGRLTREGFILSDDTDDAAGERFLSGDWSGCDLRVQYSYLASEREVIAPGILQEIFASALRLKVQGIVVPDREVRSVAVSTARSYTDKLAAMRPDRVLPATLVDKATALEQLGRDEVLALVRTWLQSVEQSENATVAA